MKTAKTTKVARICVRQSVSSPMLLEAVEVWGKIGVILERLYFDHKTDKYMCELSSPQFPGDWSGKDTITELKGTGGTLYNVAIALNLDRDQRLDYFIGD